MKKRKLAIIIAVVIVLFLVIGIAVVELIKYNIKKSNIFEEMIITTTVEEHDLSSSIVTSGIIESQYTYVVTSDTGCKIATIDVEAGDYVHVGDKLCTFDSTDLKEQIAQMEEQLKMASAGENKEYEAAKNTLDEIETEGKEQIAAATEAVTKAKALCEKKSSDYEQYKSAYDEAIVNYNNTKDLAEEILASEGKSENYISLSAQASELNMSVNTLVGLMLQAENEYDECKESVEQLETALAKTKKTVEAQISGAKKELEGLTSSAEVKKLSSELEKLKKNSDKLVVIAEKEGMITAVNVAVGEIPNAGQLMVIQDTDNLKIRVAIREADIMKIKEGMKVNITNNSNSDMHATGKVSKVIKFVTADSDMGGSYSATITLDGKSDFLLGMNAKAKIMVEEDNECMSVPFDCIAYDGEQAYIVKAVKTEQGKYIAKRVNVTVGADNSSFVAITGKDVNIGDKIVMYATMVNDGQEIIVDDAYDK